MVRQVRGQAAPGGPPIPRLPSPPPRLPAQRPTREAEPPPAALPARRRRSHCPVLSSAAIFRAPQTSGSRPGPFPQPAGRGCVRRDWGGEGGGQGGCGRLGASGPGARRGDGCHGDGQAPAPRARTRIVSAGRQLLGPERRTFWKGGLLGSGLASTSVTAPDFWPLGEGRGRSPGFPALGSRGSNLVCSFLRIPWPVTRS